MARLRVGEATVGSLVLPAIVTLGLALFSQWEDFRGWSPGFEGAFKDFLLTHSFAARPDDPLIVVVDIDDATYQQCFEPPNRLKPATVATMLDRLVEARAKRRTVFALDLLTDADRYRNLQRAESVILAVGQKPRYLEDQHFWDWLWDQRDDYYVDPTKIWGQDFDAQRKTARWAVPSYPTDSDGVVRRLVWPILLSRDSTEAPIFATAVAEAYAREADAGRLNGPKEDVHVMFDGWRPERNLKTYKAVELFSCTRAPASSGDQTSDGPMIVALKSDGMEDFASQGEGSGKPVIVLMGATYASEDYYQTPAGRKSGLSLNAYAIRSALTGNGVTEFPPFVALLVQWVGAFAIFAVPRCVNAERKAGDAERRKSVRTRTVERRVIGVVVAVFVVLGFVLHSATTMWPGLLAVLKELVADLKKEKEA